MEGDFYYYIFENYKGEVNNSEFLNRSIVEETHQEDNQNLFFVKSYPLNLYYPPIQNE
ncbi:hypothetical protein P4388_25350 [Bacillus thuringiensis]|uniref:hypothetical protein n=1 Tax=Bacillus cereus group TaxID=86661 RepID=UPI000A7360AF|nr:MULTISPECIES: hypothetical protein [Bacillus cereus group]MDA2615895.1 hypothetical protein [Bacillus cereus]MEB8556178.1 hypothetical protein [Bacillus cereus]MEB8649719.1 hypothetical protein [Bacillus cereus]MEB8670838.1 hypothetical protein [Bacillus cereus]MEB8729315.1 hypothetical protein [Bacillus cereus]